MNIQYANVNSNLHEYYLNNKTVLLRIDGNVPIANGVVLDHFKLEQVKKTIDYIIGNGACCIVLTHIGAPQEPTDTLSTKRILPWFQQYFNTKHIPDFTMLEKVERTPSLILLFENLRFFKEEKNGDQLFAKKLSSFGDIYVNDAFGSLHRFDTSITLLPLEFSKKQRTIGFLIEEELATYKRLLPIQPSLLIVGGGKPQTKLPLALKCAPFINTILLCPSLMPTQQSTLPKNVICPIDYIVYQNDELKEINSNNLSIDSSAVAIGSKTIALYQQYTEKATLIIWNGFMGFLDRPVTLDSSQKLASIIGQTHATTVIAGSDTCSFIRHHTKIASSVSHFSTGGGASLALISEQLLPGLEPFL